MTLRNFTTWLLPLASIAFFTACGGRSFQGGSGGSGANGGSHAGGSGNGGSHVGGNGSGGGANGCTVDGNQFGNGAADIAAPDGCNTCSCVNGELVCTAIGCTSTSCTYNGTFYQDGDSFQAIDGCNTCTCVEGAVACTEIGCVQPGQCSSTADCDMGQMCQFSSGTCGGAGTCVDTAVACDLSYVPVCGCDGITYGNECGAQSAGMNVSYQGECGVVTPVCGNSTCSDTQFCKYPDGYCSSGLVALPAPGGGVPAPANPGMCTDFPAACGDIYAPVCGCDGVTYASPCTADAAGMNVAYQGECPVICFDTTGCGMGEYCMYTSGFCGGGPYPPVAALQVGQVGAAIAIAPTGTCQAIPEGCTDEVAPVCGCDGVTYSNACGAAAAGMSVSYTGECAVVVPL